jgi:DNA repair exonuclease SbcCD ATPase subunit|nr:MAG TPA: minor tail protein [Caudoviricetes sp.]
MIEELKLAIKIDDATIEQSLLKQFTNAQKMADKVVLDFKNVNFDDKEIEARFKALQKKAGQNPIDLSINDNALDMLSQIDKKLTDIFNIGKGKSFIDSTPTTSAVGKIEDGIDGVSGKVDELKRKTSSGDLFGQKQINQSINSVQKLMSLLSKIKDVNKSTYGNKDNYDWTGLYKTRDEAIQDDLSTKKQNLNSSLALILAEDKNAVSTLESEINNLKSSLESIQNLANRISSNSSISSLDGKSYAEEYKLIDDRLGELNNQYKLTNAELEEYVTLQAKAEKIMDKLMSEAGGVKGSGAKNKSELRSWIEESLASDLGKNSEDIYNGLFGNITDALYNGNGISLFDVDGTKRNLREIAADILKYKSDFSDMTGSFGAKEDFSKLNELKSILSYINKNSDAINNFDFKEQIEAQKRLIKSLESNGASDSLLADEKKQLEELISLQERLDNARNGATNDNAISQQNKLQEELKETESQAEKTNDALNNSSTSSTSNDSQIEELKSDIAEVKTELSEVKEKISGIDSEGLENVRNDVEKTKESVKELNNELTDMKTNLSSGQVESNISSGNTNPPSPPKKDRYAKRRKISEEDFLNYSPNRINEKLSNSGYTILGETVNTELVNGLVKVSAKIKDADGAWKSFSAKVDADGNIFEQRFKTVTNGVDKLETALENFGRETSPALTYQETLDKAQKIKNSLNLGDEYSIKVDSSEFVTITKKLTDVENTGASVTQTFKSVQDAIDNFGKSASNSAEKTSVALKSVKSNIKEVTDESEKLANAQKEQNVNVNLNKYDKRLDSYNGKIDKYKTTISRFNDGGWTSNAYLENVQAVKNAVKEYEDLLNELKGKDVSLVTSEDINKLGNYEKKIKDTIATVTNMSAAEKGYNFVSGQKELDKIHKLLNENSRMSSEAKAKIKAYYKEIESGNPSMSLDRIHGEIMNIYNAEVEAGRAGRSFFDTLKNSGFHQIAAQMAGMFGVYDVINVIKQAASTVTELNTQITELAKVSEQSSKQIYADFDSYADIAKEVRGTISDTIAATADWSKNGYSIPDAKQLAEVSQLYKNVGDGIDINTANESLISTLKGFKLEADQAEHIVDVFNEVDLLASYYSNVIALCIHMHIDSNYIG